MSRGLYKNRYGVRSSTDCSNRRGKNYSEKGGLGSGASFEQRDIYTSTFENNQEEIVEGYFVLFFIDIVVGGNPLVDTWLVH
jgi:hypothetical protein